MALSDIPNGGLDYSPRSLTSYRLTFVNPESKTGLVTLGEAASPSASCLDEARVGSDVTGLP
jgi:hypothetical protein